MFPDSNWRKRNFKKGKNYKGVKYRKAGQRLDPVEYSKLYDDTLVAAKDAFGDRYEIIGDGKTINIGKKFTQEGLSPQQLALAQLQKENAVAGGREYVRSYETTPDDLNRALVRGAELGFFNNTSIGEIIGGGGVNVNLWDDKIRQAKFGQVGQEMSSGIDVITGGPVMNDEYHMGHIYAGNKHEHKKHFPVNTRVESAAENTAYKDFEGDDLLSTVDERLYGIGDNSTAVALGRENTSPEELINLENKNRFKDGKINESGLRRDLAGIGKRKIDDLHATLAKQRIIDSLPFEKQGPAMLALGMVEPSNILY